MTFRRYLSTQSIVFNLLFAVALVLFVNGSDASYKFVVFGTMWLPINFFLMGLGTKYTAKEDELVITNIFFVKTKIEWLKIRKIETLKQNRFSRFFLGSDEESIKIVYNTYDEALLFPKNQQAFLSELRTRANLENQPSKF